MRKFIDEGFKIGCGHCGRNLCDFAFTEDGDIIIVCKTCGKKGLIERYRRNDL
ncbi:hypothetical protein LCGC14_1670990 [marine sediment metagenome]|uniref:Uncharacterized protein n=1 Tax=marine sediment metagenome TaxID=412755 RepID=A0A0F9KR65_9ZZZZ